jgi:hypothetical protein
MTWVKQVEGELESYIRAQYPVNWVSLTGLESQKEYQAREQRVAFLAASRQRFVGVPATVVVQ